MGPGRKGRVRLEVTGKGKEEEVADRVSNDSLKKFRLGEGHFFRRKKSLGDVGTRTDLRNPLIIEKEIRGGRRGKERRNLRSQPQGWNGHR